MKKLLIIVSAGLLCLGVATSGSAVPYTGSISLAVAGLPGVPVTGGGSAGGVGGAVTFTIAAGDMAVVGLILPITDPAAAPILGLQVTASNGAGAFAGGGGSMALLGIANVCLFAVCSAPPPANVGVPLSVVGVGGTTDVSLFVNVTVIGAPWVTTTAAIGTLTAMGGTTGGGAAGGGSVTLVTPVFISTNIGASAVLPSFATLTLNFVPEPGTLLLLGSGIAGLAALGRRRLG